MPYRCPRCKGINGDHVLDEYHLYYTYRMDSAIDLEDGNDLDHDPNHDDGMYYCGLCGYEHCDKDDFYYEEEESVPDTQPKGNHI